MILSGVSRKDFYGKYRIKSNFKEFNNYASKLIISDKSYNDKLILRRLEKQNAEYNYRLNPTKMVEIAEKAMFEITEKKKHFHTKMLELKWGTIAHLEDSDDPAKTDPELERKLKMNHNYGNRRLQNEITRYIGYIRTLK